MAWANIAVESIHSPLVGLSDSAHLPMLRIRAELCESGTTRRELVSDHGVNV